jgi:TrmH family RNA methyltransferase
MREKGSPQLLGRHNPRVARLRRIIGRQQPELTAVDGLKLTLDLAAAGVPIVELFTVAAQLDALRASPEIERVFQGGRAHLLDPATAAQIAPTRQTQGVLAVVAVPDTRLAPIGVIVYLDRVQDPGNVGSVIRCAAALGASGVACSPGCADPFSPRAVRASAGQALVFPVQIGAAFAALADAVRRAGGEAFATASRASVPLSRWHPHAPLLLALGNEGQGVSEEVMLACAGQVAVPLQRGVESLNVASTAAVILAALAGVARSPILKLQDTKGGRGDPTS